MNQNHFNGAFARAFPTETHNRIARTGQQDALRRAHDPFGGVFDDDALSKIIHHHFENGHRVRVNSPGHHAHGSVGVITDDRSDSRLEVKLDSGHVIHCGEPDLTPEDFPEAGDSTVTRIAKSRVRIGDRVRLKDGRRGRVSRFANAGNPASTFDDPHTVHVDLENPRGAGVDVSLDDIELDDDDTMALPGAIRNSPESRPDPETDAQGQRDTEGARRHAENTGNSDRPTYPSTPSLADESRRHIAQERENRQSKIAARNPMAVEDDVLAKRTKGADFKVGDQVQDRWGHVGKITKITAAHAEIDYSSGVHGRCLIGYFEHAA
jgi:hypothetical protein